MRLLKSQSNLLIALSALALSLFGGILFVPSMQIMSYRILLETGPAPVRAWSVERLMAWRSQGSEALALFALDETQEDKKLRAKAFAFLGSLREEARPAIPILIAALENPEERISLDAYTTLGEMGPVSAPALMKVVEDLDQNVNLRCTAVEILGSIRPSPAVVIATLIQVLKNPNDSLRWGAASALGRIGPKASDAVPALIVALLKDPHRWVRDDAATALGEIGLMEHEAVPALAEALADEAGSVRQCSAKSLGVFGGAAAFAVPALIKTLDDFDEDIRRESARCLERIGPSASDAIPALTACLKDPIDAVRIRAAAALAEIGPKASDAVPALTEALNDPFEEDKVRAEIRAALDTIHAANRVMKKD